MGLSGYTGPHDNSWMQYPGQLIGTGVGMFYGGPLGAMAGGQGGKSAGLALGDLFGGNWNGFGSDIEDQIGQGLQAGQMGMNPIQMLGGLPGMSGGGNGGLTSLPPEILQMLGIGR